MPPLRWYLAFLLSSAAALAAPWFRARGLASPTALALYPWIVLCGFPGWRREGTEPPALRGLALDTLLMAPPVILALRLEAGGAVPAREAIAMVISGAALAAGSGLAARVALGRAASQRAYAIAWLGMLGAALARAVSGWGRESSSLPELLDRVCAATPFAWIHEQVGGAEHARLPIGSFIWVLVTLVLAGFVGRERIAPSRAEGRD